MHGLCVLSWSVACRSSELDNIYAHPLPWYPLASSADVLQHLLSLLHGMQALLRVSCPAMHYDSVLKTAYALCLSTASTLLHRLNSEIVILLLLPVGCP